MSKTLFLKDNTLHIRLKEGEYEVSPECYTKGISRDGESYWYNVDTGTTIVGIGEKEKFEWLGGVELIELPDEGRDMSGPPYSIVDFKTVARLLQEEKKDYLFEINPTLSSSNSSTAHSFTEDSQSPVNQK